MAKITLIVQGCTIRNLLNDNDDQVVILDAIAPVIDIYRNSHVDTWVSLSEEARQWLFDHSVVLNPAPDPTQFWADMLPVGGPVLGPFKRHKFAIAAEVQWLEENNLPLPAKYGDADGVTYNSHRARYEHRKSTFAEAGETS
jgi:hypothetical protein